MAESSVRHRWRLLLAGALVLSVAFGLVVALAGTATPRKNGMIAFTRYRLQNKPLRSEIFVANPDGSGVRKVSHSPTAREDDQARWSPDGKWIVFDRCTPVTACSVWLVRADGSGQYRLSADCPSNAQSPPACVDDSNPAFGPDSKHVVFQRESGQIRHEPSGDQIERSAVVITDLNGKHPITLLQVAGYRGDLQAPRISPDGKQIVVEQTNSNLVRPRGGQALFIANIDGSGLRRLTPWSMNAAGADWSPDGQRILFKSSAADGELTPGSNLYTIRPDGTALQQLTHVPSTSYVLSGSFSPDGKAIVFGTDHEIVVMQIGSNKLTRVTGTANLDGWPTWGPAPDR
jgi:Tol biopolymer transport system component